MPKSQSTSNLDEFTLNAFAQPVVIADPEFASDGKISDIKIRWANTFAKQIPNAPRLIGKSLSDLTPDLHNEAWMSDLLSARNHQSEFSQIRTMMRLGANSRPYELVLFWHGEEIVGLVIERDGSSSTVASIVQAMDSISSLMKQVPVAFGVRADGAWFRSGTDAFCNGLGLTREEFSTFDLLNHIVKEDQAKVKAWLEASLHNEPAVMTVQVELTDGTTKFIEAWIADMALAGVPDQAKMAIFRDLDALIRQTEAAKEAKRAAESDLGALSKALNVSRDGFAIWKAIRDGNERIEDFELQFINKVGAAPTGQHPGNLIGKTLTESLEGAQGDHLRGLFERALREAIEVVDVVDLNTAQGWVGAYENRVVPITEDSIATSFRDISEQKREEHRLQWLLDHDTLTGLASRRALELELERTLNASRTTPEPFAFAFIDLDHFKTVNDSHGHAAGDMVLVEFGNRLKAAVGTRGFAARISGDEFAVIVNGVEDKASAEAWAVNMRELLAKPYELDGGKTVQLTCSTGLAQVRNFASGASEILRFADRAMYSVKLNGRDGYQVAQL